MRIALMVLVVVGLFAVPAMADDTHGVADQREEINKKITRYEELLAASKTKEAAQYFTTKIYGLEKRLANLPLAALIQEREDAGEVDRWIKSLESKDNDTAFTGAVELARLKSARAVPALVKHLVEHKDFYVRLGAATALGDIGHKDGIGPLIDALDDKDDLVRTASYEALNKITGQDFGFQSHLSRDQRVRIQRRYRAWHQAAHPEAARKKPARLLRPVKKPPAFADLVKRLQHDDVENRMKAAIELGGSTRFAAIAPLVEALNDKSETVREAVHQALIELTGYAPTTAAGTEQNVYRKWVEQNREALKESLK